MLLSVSHTTSNTASHWMVCHSNAHRSSNMDDRVGYIIANLMVTNDLSRPQPKTSCYPLGRLIWCIFLIRGTAVFSLSLQFRDSDPAVWGEGGVKFAWGSAYVVRARIMHDLIEASCSSFTTAEPAHRSWNDTDNIADLSHRWLVKVVLWSHTRLVS